MVLQNSLAQLTAGWSRLPVSQVAYTESTGEPRSPVTEELRPDGTRTISVMRVPWIYRQNAVQKDILESASITSKNGVAFISRVMPRPYLAWTDPNGKPYLYAAEIMRTSQQGLPEFDRTEGVQQHNFLTNLPDWCLASLEILYTDRVYNVVSDAAMLQSVITGGAAVPDEASLQRYVYITSQAGGSILPIPAGAFQAVTHLDGTSPAAQPGQPGINLPTDEILIRWFYVPKLAIGARSVNFDVGLPNYWIDKCRGCVNLSNFPAGSPGPFPPGTLLFTGMTPIPVRGPLGDRYYHCDFKMRFLNLGGLTDPLNGNYYIGHNHKLTKISGDTTAVWRQLTVDGKDNFPGSANNAVDGDSLYNWRDFNKMFRVPQAGL